MNQTTCELCKEARAVMLLYAMNPGSQQPTATERNISPLYPPEQSDVALNLCVDCFHDMAQTMRDEKYVAIRATAPRLNKPEGTV